MNERRFLWVLALLLVATRASAVDWFGDPIISPLPGVPTSASVGNLDAVPGLDVAVGSEGGVIWILSGDGAGGFALATTLSSPSASTYVEVGDFDGDGRDDLAAADYQNGPGIRVFLGDGEGGLQESMVVDSDLLLYQFVAHDMDGDGKDDLVAGGGERVEVHWGAEGGFAASPFTQQGELGICNSTHYARLLVVDTDGDPHIDIALVARVSQSSCGLPSLNGLARFRGQANRQFGLVEWLVVEEYDIDDRWESGAAGDIDGDLDLDFVISPQVSDLRVFLEDSPGNWVPGPVVEGAKLGLSVSPLHDLDQSGTLDLVGSGRRVVSGSGEGEFHLADTTGVTGTILGLEDLDTVPGVDVIGLNRSYSQLHVLPNLIYADPAAIDGLPRHRAGGMILRATPSVWAGEGTVRIDLQSPDGALPRPRSSSPSVPLSVFDLQGRVVASLAPDVAHAPVSEGAWSAWSWDPPASLPAGIYWLRVPGVREPARVVLLR